jgi:hypothetical protein
MPQHEQVSCAIGFGQWWVGHTRLIMQGMAICLLCCCRRDQRHRCLKVVYGKYVQALFELEKHALGLGRACTHVHRTSSQQQTNDHRKRRIGTCGSFCTVLFPHGALSPPPPTPDFLPPTRALREPLNRARYDLVFHHVLGSSGKQPTFDAVST